MHGISNHLILVSHRLTKWINTLVLLQLAFTANYLLKASFLRLHAASCSWCLYRDSREELWHPAICTKPHLSTSLLPDHTAWSTPTEGGPADKEKHQTHLRISNDKCLSPSMHRGQGFQKGRYNKYCNFYETGTDQIQISPML